MNITYIPQLHWMLSRWIDVPFRMLTSNGVKVDIG